MRSFQSGNNNTAGAPDDFTRSRKVGLRLHQVLLRVKDVERSREFYTKKLGFKVLHDFSPEYVAVLTPNKLQIGLHPFRRDRARPWDRDQPVGVEFEVDNVDFWYRRLRNQGIRFSEKPKDSWENGKRVSRTLMVTG